ncbi:class I SAM-dependent methyltransferase [Tanticharoenia sakaeratensis]|nr:class I SAM-dependent methyltransferase [Tanticharoenia sakaeratensis]
MKADCFREIPVTREPVFETPDDEKAYWQANPDVASCGLPAAQHYREHGRHEGRLQAINQEQVAELRERKLRKIAFREQPVTPRHHGAAANFITDAIRQEFHIPPFPPISAHNYGGYISGLQKEHPDWMFLDVGAGLRDTVSDSMVNADIFDALSTDVVCVGEKLPFEDAQFDFVLCAATLEHTKRPWEVAAEICRVLKPGGIVRIDYPFLQPVHGYPSHYFNATPEGSISLFEKWCELRYSIVEKHFHPVHSLRWMLKEWKNGLPNAAGDRFGGMTVNDFLSGDISHLLMQDVCTDLDPAVEKVICSGTTLEAVKKSGDHYYASEREERLAEVAQQRARDIDTIRSSTSWKITAPLRAAIAAMRAIRSRKH